MNPFRMMQTRLASTRMTGAVAPGLPLALTAGLTMGLALSAVTTDAAHAATTEPSPHHHHHAATASTAKSTSAKTEAAHYAAKHHAAESPKAHHPAHAAQAHEYANHALPAHAAPPHHGVIHHAPAAAAPAPAVALPAVPAPPPPAPEPDKGTNTGLPLPRFAAFRADEVNMRVGPGQQFPIQWVYHRRGLPVQIEREFDVWRLVEDSDGVKGWVHQATLVGSRDFVVPGDGSSPALGAATANTGHMEPRIIGYMSSSEGITAKPGDVVLRADGDESSGIVAILKPGTVGTLKTCAAGSAWCKVVVRGYGGWVPRKAIWGLAADEAFPSP